MGANDQSNLFRFTYLTWLKSLLLEIIDCQFLDTGSKKRCFVRWNHPEITQYTNAKKQWEIWPKIKVSSNLDFSYIREDAGVYDTPKSSLYIGFLTKVT